MREQFGRADVILVGPGSDKQFRYFHISPCAVHHNYWHIQELTTLNLLKSVFISVFVTWLSMISLYAFVRLASGTEPLISWFGLAMATFSPLAFFIKAFLFKSPRTRRHPLEYSILSGLGLAVTMAMSFRYGESAGNIHIWAGITLLGWLAYLRWYSVFKGRNTTGYSA